MDKLIELVQLCRMIQLDLKSNQPRLPELDQSVKAVELNKRQKQAELVEQLKRVYYTKYTNR